MTPDKSFVAERELFAVNIIYIVAGLTDSDQEPVFSTFHPASRAFLRAWTPFLLDQ